MVRQASKVRGPSDPVTTRLIAPRWDGHNGNSHQAETYVRRPRTKRTPSSPHLSLNHDGRWGITDDFTTSFLHFTLFSAALWDLAYSRPVVRPIPDVVFPPLILLSACLVFFPSFRCALQSAHRKIKTRILDRVSELHRIKGMVTR